MDLNRAVNPQNQPDTRQEGHISHGVMLHQFIFLPVMGVLGWLLQLKYTSGNGSPFVSDNITMLMFIVAFFGYFGFLSMKLLAQPHPNSDVRDFISNMTFLFGTLATILLLLILVRAFGMFALLLWTIYLVRDVATKKSYMSVACHAFNRVKELMINGHLEEINDVQPQPTPHIVLQIQDEGEPNSSC